MKFGILGLIGYIAVTQAFQDRFWRQVEWVDKKVICRLEAWVYTVAKKEFSHHGCIGRIWNTTHDLIGHLHVGVQEGEMYVRTKSWDQRVFCKNEHIYVLDIDHMQTSWIDEDYVNTKLPNNLIEVGLFETQPMYICRGIHRKGGVVNGYVGWTSGNGTCYRHNTDPNRDNGRIELLQYNSLAVAMYDEKVVIPVERPQNQTYATDPEPYDHGDSADDQNNYY